MREKRLQLKRGESSKNNVAPPHRVIGDKSSDASKLDHSLASCSLPNSFTLPNLN